MVVSFLPLLWTDEPCDCLYRRSFYLLLNELQLRSRATMTTTADDLPPPPRVSDTGAPLWDDDSDDDEDWAKCQQISLFDSSKPKKDKKNGVVSPENTDEPATTKAAKKSTTDKVPQLSAEVLEERARKKAAVFARRLPTNLADPALVKVWKGKNKALLPCCIVPHPSPDLCDMTDLKQGQQLVQYLGASHRYAASYEAVHPRTLHPYHADPTSRVWNPTDLKAFHRSIAKQHYFVAEPGEINEETKAFKLRVEDLALQLQLDEVWRRFQAREALEEQRQQEEEEALRQADLPDGSDVPSIGSAVVTQREEDDHEDDNDEDAAAEAPAEEALFTATGRRARRATTVNYAPPAQSTSRPRLRAGDIILYRDPHLVCSAENTKQARITQVLNENDLALEINNHQTLRHNAQIQLVQRYLRGKYEASPWKSWSFVSDFDLDKANNARVAKEAAAQKKASTGSSLFSGALVDDMMKEASNWESPSKASSSKRKAAAMEEE